LTGLFTGVDGFLSLVGEETRRKGVFFVGKYSLFMGKECVKWLIESENGG
jgi:hypothetical protein